MFRAVACGVRGPCDSVETPTIRPVTDTASPGLFGFSFSVQRWWHPPHPSRHINHGRRIGKGLLSGGGVPLQRDLDTFFLLAKGWWCGVSEIHFTSRDSEREGQLSKFQLTFGDAPRAPPLPPHDETLGCSAMWPGIDGQLRSIGPRSQRAKNSPSMRSWLDIEIQEVCAWSLPLLADLTAHSTKRVLRAARSRKGAHPSR